MNKKWILNKRPIGYPKEQDFKLIESSVDELDEGEIIPKDLSKFDAKQIFNGVDKSRKGVSMCVFQDFSIQNSVA